MQIRVFGGTLRRQRLSESEDPDSFILKLRTRIRV